MQLTDPNRRFARDIPGIHGMRAVCVGKVSTFRAHCNFVDASRRRGGWDVFLSGFQIQRVDDTKE